jgi:O-acetyl-ADP-ribose deacetylase (regulator of RNase III)
MIEFYRGDLLTAQAEALVNTVNCVGIMGRGIALQMKNAFPDNFREYAAACRRHEVEPGRMFVHETGQLGNPRWIINFPTKRHWRGKSRIEDIEAGLVALVAEVRARDIHSIALPPLGCGLGGLDWADVRPLIERAFANLPEVNVVVFEPAGAPSAERMPKSATPPKMTAGRAALVGLMQCYLGGLMDPFVSLLELHKLTYFLQEAGEGLRLSFRQAHYGPYAENLRHVLTRIDGHLISGFGDGEDDPEKPLELVPGATADARRYIDAHHDTRKRFDRVAELVEGFETPFGLELLATVHWVASREGAATAEDLVCGVYAWGERKHRFSEGQIRLAWQRLRTLGWLPAPEGANAA